MQRRAYEASPARIERGENAQIWSGTGLRYVDFSTTGGAGVTGHRHPTVMRAIQEQLGRILHVGLPFAGTEASSALAHRLEALVPIAGECRTHWTTTGAEAVEVAVSMARRHTGRRAVLAFAGSRHGTTGLARSLSGVRMPFSDGGEMASDVHFLPFPHAATGATLDDTRKALKLLFRTRLAAQDVAAVICECVQGEAGVVPASATLMRDLRALCDRDGIVFIVDEARTALACTGKLFAIEHFDVEPDLIVMATGLSEALPLAAVVGRRAIVSLARLATPAQPLWGHAVAVAAAHAVLDVVHEEQLCSRAIALGRMWNAHMQDARRSLAAIADVRGLGAMRALEFRQPTGAPDAALTRAVCEAAWAAGVLVSRVGMDDNVIQFQLPLTLSDIDLAAGMESFIVAMSGARA